MSLTISPLKSCCIPPPKPPPNPPPMLPENRYFKWHMKITRFNLFKHIYYLIKNKWNCEPLNGHFDIKGVSKSRRIPENPGVLQVCNIQVCLNFISILKQYIYKEKSNPEYGKYHYFSKQKKSFKTWHSSSF